MSRHNTPSENLLRCIPHFTVLSKVKNINLRKKVLADMCAKDKTYCKGMKEICNNLVHGNIKLPKKMKKKLWKHRKIIRSVATVLESRNPRRKKLVIQTGGFIHLLLPAVLSTLSSILYNRYRQQ